MKHEYKTNSQRVAEKLLRGQPKAKPFGKLIGGRFYTGTKSLHRTKQSRAQRLFLRLRLRAWYGIRAIPRGQDRYDM
jgi:hypothetical protein